MLRIFNDLNKINEYIFLNFEKKKNFLIIKILQNIKNNFPKIITHVGLNNTDFDLFLKNNKFNIYLLAFCKNAIIYQLNNLIDIIGVDFPGKKKRFGLIYICQSIHYNIRINLLLRCVEKEKILSIIKIFKNADWAEREVWDMFGILFQKHSDLRRILTDYGFCGHPLRKDFPLTGFYELFFVDTQKIIKSMPVCLAQEYRKFYFPLPW